MVKFNSEQRRDVILNNTEVVRPALLPEMRLRLTTRRCPLWRMRADEFESSGLGEPYWAFAWAGGQGMARFILDHPELVMGKRVLDIATGSGLIAIAAAMAGAAHVSANDIDPFCREATALNSALNQVTLSFDPEDRVGEPLPGVDVVVAGDICYEEPLSARISAWFHQLARGGVEVYVGDPGRATLKREGLEQVARYRPHDVQDHDDGDVRRARVFKVTGV
ncbi:MAG: 50S ribosomal protein L11 methyltransferase [Myxococcota bacterium]|nr:50S ribosomal protein L11 methyltransferase [Myxococcota bacterium]